MASETVQVLQLQGAVRTGDVQSFLTALRAKWEQLGSSSYRAIQYDLKVSFSEAQYAVANAKFLCVCLKEILATDHAPAGLVHILLDAAVTLHPSRSESALPQDVRAGAAALFWQALGGPDARVPVKLAQGFGLQLEDLTSGAALPGADISSATPDTQTTPLPRDRASAVAPATPTAVVHVGEEAESASSLKSGAAVSSLSNGSALQPTAEMQGISAERGVEALVAHIAGLLKTASTITPAVGLLMQFPKLAEARFDRGAVLDELATQGQAPLAERWAADLGKGLQASYVRSCVGHGRLREACLAVRRFGLQETFPTVFRDFRAHSVRRLMEKALWAKAAALAEGDAQLEGVVVAELAAVGEAALAAECAAHFRLEPSTLCLDAAQVAAQQAARAERYLALPGAGVEVRWVDSGGGVVAAAGELWVADALGVDVEWRPTHLSGAAAPASLLQVASRTLVCVFDLLALRGAPELGAALGPLLGAESVAKVGVGLADDLRRVAASVPGLAAALPKAGVPGVTDLRAMWRARLQTQGVLGARRRAEATGLSAMAEALLGRPLDKGMQMSDWEARPLTPRQLAYAALDAHAALRIYDALVSEANTAAVTTPLAYGPAPGKLGPAISRAGNGAALQAPGAERRGQRWGHGEGMPGAGGAAGGNGAGLAWDEAGAGVLCGSSSGTAVRTAAGAGTVRALGRRHCHAAPAPFACLASRVLIQPRPRAAASWWAAAACLRRGVVVRL